MKQRILFASVLGLSCILCWALQANWLEGRPQGKATKKESNYPFALSVDANTSFRRVGEKFRFPSLHYRKLGPSNAKNVEVVVRVPFADHIRILRAGQTLSPTGVSGTWRPQEWSGNLSGLFEFLELLAGNPQTLERGRMTGQAAIDVALFNPEFLGKEEKDKGEFAPESARLSPWLKVPAKFK